MDICFAADDLDAIPNADKWVIKADIEDLKKKDDRACAVWIAQEHQKFKAERKSEEKTLTNVCIHPDLKLRYAW